ncbi:phage portal protein [Cupriavidus sp. AcVe19-6a]|uniref:phage portal protein n=1 Tax=Cupriavidus sp. AcVe19-6a TaxID=2821358 RepID=UPI001AE23FAB|nr:phage portal protein [Cupriavidus sp. AcVe19-6a]MBP0634904.1 phage portal protein [Cupriavidus sp. AcVe19-6a]
MNALIKPLRGAWTRIKTAAVVVGRAFSLRDARQLMLFFGGGSWAGKNVNVDTAMQLSTVWACARLVSTSIGTMPLFLYRVQADGARKKAKRQALYRILHTKPNAYMSAAEYWTAVVLAVLFWGNSFSRISRNKDGDIVSLMPLRPDWITLRVNPDYSLTYVFRDETGKLEELSPAEVFHVKGFSLDGLVGISCLAQARHSMGISLALEESAGRVFVNGMKPGGVLQVDTILKEADRERMRSQLTEQFAGAINSGKTMILEGGLKFQAVTMNPEDAQMLQSRSYSVEELCRWFNVPPFMIGHTEKSTSWGSGIEEQKNGFVTFTLQPTARLIEQAIGCQLIPPEDGEDFAAEFNFDAMLRGNSVQRAQYLSTMTQNGLMTRDEGRAHENLPPMGGNAAVLTVQRALVPLNLLDEVSGAQETVPGDPQNPPDANAPPDPAALPLQPTAPPAKADESFRSMFKRLFAEDGVTS